MKDPLWNERVDQAANTRDGEQRREKEAEGGGVTEGERTLIYNAVEQNKKLGDYEKENVSFINYGESS